MKIRKNLREPVLLERKTLILEISEGVYFRIREEDGGIVITKSDIDTGDRMMIKPRASNQIIVS